MQNCKTQKEKKCSVCSGPPHRSRRCFTDFFAQQQFPAHKQPLQSGRRFFFHPTSVRCCASSNHCFCRYHQAKPRRRFFFLSHEPCLFVVPTTNNCFTAAISFNPDSGFFLSFALTLLVCGADHKQLLHHCHQFKPRRRFFSLSHEP